MELVSFGVRLVKTHIKNVGEEPPQAELNFSMKWVGIIFKTSRNAKGKAGKKKNKKKQRREKESKTGSPGLLPYQARPNHELLGRGMKKRTMHECNMHGYAISKRKEIKAW